MELFDPTDGFGLAAVVLGVEVQYFVVVIIIDSLFGVVEDVPLLVASRTGEGWVKVRVGGVDGRGVIGDGQYEVFGDSRKSGCLTGGTCRPAFCRSCFLALGVFGLALRFVWVRRFSGAGLCTAASSSAVADAGVGWWVAVRMV